MFLVVAIDQVLGLAMRVSGRQGNLEDKVARLKVQVDDRTPARHDSFITLAMRNITTPRDEEDEAGGH
jgi:hypothetical protein